LGAPGQGRVLGEGLTVGSFAATYKYALLVALVELALERGDVRRSGCWSKRRKKALALDWTAVATFVKLRRTDTPEPHPCP